MTDERRLAVGMKLTPDPELLPVVERVTGWFAEQAGFGEGQRLNLQQGVGRACRRWMERGPRAAEALNFHFAGFSDRVEIVVEDGNDAALPSEADSFLLGQLLDKVVVEGTEEGKLRLTLVQYVSGAGSQP